MKNVGEYNWAHFRSHLTWWGAGLLLFVLFIGFYPHYLLNNTFFWLSLITLPVSVIRSTRGNYPFYALALALSVLSFLLPTTIGIYGLVCLGALFLAQSATGALHPLVLVHAGIISPLFTYMNSLVSIPIRLELSSAVTFVLNRIGYDARAEGNLIYLNDELFLVDEACSGMYMLSYGILFGTLVLSLFARTHVVNGVRLVLYYLLLLGLLLLSNLSRITLLVIFNVPAEHWFHEGLGLTVYLIQVLLPFTWLVKATLRRRRVLTVARERASSAFPVYRYALILVLFFGLVHLNRSASEVYRNDKMEIAGYESKKLPSGVLKFSKEDALLYMKPPVAPYRADHNPMICWKGSGYAFKKIEKWPIHSSEVNMAELVKKDDKLYTAWWFESPDQRTASQWEWRKSAFQHKQPFYLANLTCNSKKELIDELEQLFEQSFTITL